MFLAEPLARITELSSRPERTRISYFALLATSTCAALRTESRLQILNATGLHRKSGGVQWRDLRFRFQVPTCPTGCLTKSLPGDSIRAPGNIYPIGLGEKVCL